MSVQKLFFTMENLSWSWQGMLTVSHLIKSLPGVTGFRPHIDRVTLELCIHRAVALQLLQLKMVLLQDPRDNNLLFPLEWKMVYWEMP